MTLTLSGVGQNDTTEVSKYGEPNSSTILFREKVILPCTTPVRVNPNQLPPTMGKK